MSLVEKYLNDPRGLQSTSLEMIKPIWWKDAYDAMVLDHFKMSNGEDSGAKIDHVKTPIVELQLKGMPELKTMYEYMVPRVDMYTMEFDAQLFHAIIREKGESDKYQDKDLIMKRFDTVNVEKDLLCTWATLELPDEDSPQHLVLKHKRTSQYRCTFCGNMLYILRCETMPHQFIQKYGSEQRAKKARDRIMRGFRALELDTPIHKIFEAIMLEAGLYDANNPPAERAP